MRDWDDVIVEINWGKPDENGVREGGTQYHGNVIPVMGAKFSFYASRDSDGNYNPNGEVKHIVTGTVTEISYLLQRSGKDSSSYREAIWIYVTLEDVEERES